MCTATDRTRFARSWPAIKIAIVEGSRSELLEPLRDGAIDFTLGALRDPMVEPDLLQEPLFEDRPQVFARRGHPLENARPDLAALARHEFLLPPAGTPLRDLWDEGFRRVGLDPPRVTLETGSVMMIRQMLLETDRLTLLSPDQLSAEIAAGMVVPVLTPQSGPVRSIGITMRAEWRPTSAQEAFLKTLRALSC